MRMRRPERNLSLLFLLALGGLVGLPRAVAQDTITLDCAADHQAFHEGRLYVACGARLVVLELAGPRVLLDRTEASPIRGFHQAAGVVWVELDEGRARRVALAATAETAEQTEPEEPAEPSAESAAALGRETAPEPLPAPEPSAPTVVAPPTPPARPAPGRVLAVHDDEVTIDLGRSSGLEIGDHVDLSTPELATGEPGGWEAGEAAVIGVVDAVDEGRARVRIRWGEAVSVEGPANRTDAPISGSRVAPPAPPRGWRLSGSAIVGTPVDDLGIQLVARGAVELRARRFLLARLVLRPTGISVGKGRELGSGGVYAQLGFDHRFVGAAVGVGIESVYSDERREWDPARMVSVTVAPASWDPWAMFPTSFRLGAVDGLMTEVTTMLTVRAEALQLLAVEARVQIPLVNGLWLIARGGGGSRAAFWHGEGIVRLTLRGNGHPGTTMLDVGIGAVGLSDRVPDGIRRLGPSLVVGVTHQL